MTHTHEEYLWLLENRICASCDKREAMPGHTQCAVCAEETCRRKSERLRARRQAGTCFHCGQAPEPGFKTCRTFRMSRRKHLEGIAA